jgi:hypothetical protein
LPVTLRTAVLRRADQLAEEVVNGLLIWPMLVAVLVAVPACVSGMMLARRQLPGDPRNGQRARLGD